MIRPLISGDHLQLLAYLQELDADAQRFFSPHGNSPEALASFYLDPKNRGWCYVSPETGRIGAYAVLRCGGLEHDTVRMVGYGFKPDERIDASFAPSVATDFRGTGVAAQLWARVLEDAISLGSTRIFLWGGVKAENHRAINFYVRCGFLTVGRFIHEGDNIDMVYLVRGVNPTKS